MSDRTNLQIAIDYTEQGWGKGNLQIIDELVAPEAIDHHPLAGMEANREGAKKSIQAIHNSFPDTTFKVLDSFEADNKVATRWVFEGTHQAEFFGVPTTGRHVTTSGIMIFRIENGQIQEWWHEYDLFGFMNQLTAK
jgi:steroid delta-isomerase-like uncharacterized protein